LFDSVTRLVVASSAASSSAATLLEAYRSLSSTNSPTQQQVEASAKDVIQRLTLFVSTAMNFPTPANSVGTDQMEKHMRVMQLEETLQRERSSVRCLLSFLGDAKPDFFLLSLFPLEICRNCSQAQGSSPIALAMTRTEP